MQHTYETLQVEARNLKMMSDRIERQFTAEAFDRKQAERSYDWFEGAVEQFLLADIAMVVAGGICGVAVTIAIEDINRVRRTSEKDRV